MLHLNSSFFFCRVDTLEPFTAAKPEYAPYAFNDLVDFQEHIDPEGRPMENKAGKIAKRNGCDPQKQNITNH